MPPRQCRGYDGSAWIYITGRYVNRTIQGLGEMRCTAEEDARAMTADVKNARGGAMGGMHMGCAYVRVGSGWRRSPAFAADVRR